MGIILATDLSFGSSFFAKSRPVLIERMFACKFDGYFTAKTDGGQPSGMNFVNLRRAGAKRYFNFIDRS